MPNGGGNYRPLILKKDAVPVLRADDFSHF